MLQKKQGEYQNTLLWMPITEVHSEHFSSNGWLPSLIQRASHSQLFFKALVSADFVNFLEKAKIAVLPTFKRQQLYIIGNFIYGKSLLIGCWQKWQAVIV